MLSTWERSGFTLSYKSLWLRIELLAFDVKNAQKINKLKSVQHSKQVSLINLLDSPEKPVTLFKRKCWMFSEMLCVTGLGHFWQVQYLSNILSRAAIEKLPLMESLLKLFKNLNWSNLYLSQRKMLKCVLLQKGISFWTQLDIFSLKRKSAAQVDTKSALQRAVSPTGKIPETKTSPAQWSISSGSFPTVAVQKHKMWSISQAVFLRSYTTSFLVREGSQCLLDQLVLG